MDSSTSEIIAVVDDDEWVRRSVENLFLSLGFRVETFASPEAFLQSDRLEGIACLIVDQRMPGMSGLDLLNALSAAGSRVPTIVLTAHGAADVRVRSLQAGAIAFLQKPLDMSALLQIVKTVTGAGHKRPEDFASRLDC